MGPLQAGTLTDIKDALRLAVAGGSREAWYASLAEDQLPSLCVEVLRDGTYSNLEQLLLAADHLTQRLEELGIVVRPHGNVDDDATVVRCFEALQEQLAGGKARSDLVLQRDADSMAVVWRRRRRARTGRWPGGWIVTKDRAISPAYLRAQSQDKVSLTLTTAQWATLLSISAKPVDVEDLARAAADQFVDEAAWTLPVRYPPEVALELARQLSPEHGGSDTDLRVAQMSLDEALETPDSAAIASMVLSGRTRRVNSISQADRERWSQGLETEREDAKAARLKAAEETAARVQTEQMATNLGSDNRRLSTDLTWSRKQLRRVLVSAGVGLIFSAVLTASLFLSGIATNIVLIIGGLVLTYSLAKWCQERDAKVWPIALGTAINVIGVISGVMQIFKVGPF